MSEEIDRMYDELQLLADLMATGKKHLDEKGIDSDADVLYKLAFTAMSDGRKQEYFAKKADEEKRSRNSSKSYGERSSRYSSYDRR